MRKKKKVFVVMGVSVLLFAAGALAFSDSLYPSGRALPRRILEGIRKDMALGRPIFSRIIQRIKYANNAEGKLQVGDMAPDVRLLTAHGNSEIRLYQLLRDKPLVLIFGSYT